MSYCNEVSNKWMEVRAAFFLVNFLKNHRQDIDNSSVFHLLDIAVSNEKFQQAVKEHFSSAEQKKSRASSIKNWKQTATRKISSVLFGRVHLCVTSSELWSKKSLMTIVPVFRKNKKFRNTIGQNLSR